MNRIKVDIFRVAVMVFIATILVKYSVQFAQFSDEPAFAPWGLFAGLALYGVALSHVLRKLLFPYIDLKMCASNANKTSTGSGLVFLGVCIVLTAFLLLMGNLVHATEIPDNAKKYIPLLKAEQGAYWPHMPMPSTLAAQVEQETCISLKSPRCWSPRTELKTARERGVGLGQITKTARFDALDEIRRAYPSALAGWDWNSEKLYDPQYQLRALVLKDLQGWKTIQGAATVIDHLAFTFASYNGGIGGVLSDRRVCRATAACNSNQWFGHVERTSLKSKTAGYQKSFFQINREYVKNILLVRRYKYETLL